MVLLNSLSSLILLSLFLCGCQLGYILESSYYQADLMRRRVPLKYALENIDLKEPQRKRIELAITLRQFMAQDLNLDTKNNFLRYVHLEQPYVTYVVNASDKDQLKTYEWSFPIIGTVPYKGFFKKEKALALAKDLQDQGYDTHVRGVAAYSTLGWFEDPLLSSMLNMPEHHYISTLIHETVHSNLYIKSHSKFNERVATFLGRLGAETYYRSRNKSQELKKIWTQESHDELIFSEFISSEIKALRQWYKEQKGSPINPQVRGKRLQAINQNFAKNVLPKMQTERYAWFADKQLNNAFLLLFDLYVSDFSDFETLADHYDRDFKSVFNHLKSLEKVDDPEKKLKVDIQKLNKALTK
jgi:predicted aminopeptidase